MPAAMLAWVNVGEVSETAKQLVLLQLLHRQTQLCMDMKNSGYLLCITLSSKVNFLVSLCKTVVL